MAFSRDLMRRASAEPGRLAIAAPSRLTFGELASMVQLQVLSYGRKTASPASDEPASMSEAPPASGRSYSPIVACSEEPLEVLIEVLAANFLQEDVIVADPTWPDDLRERALAAARTALGKPTGATRFVVFTSGSTGLPKPVVRSITSWTWSFPTFSAYTGIGPEDTVLIPGRLSGSLFLFGAMHALTMGAPIHFLPRFTPEAAADAARTSTVAHAVPTMLPALIADKGRLRLVACAGAHIDSQTVDRVAEAGIELIDYYGAAETSFVAIRRGAAPLKAFPGVEVSSRDGILYVKSPYLAGNVEKDDEGWATVGDHGVVDEHGVVAIIGRSGGAISTGGTIVYPESVERVLRRQLDEVAVVGLPHPTLGAVVAAIIPRSTREIPSLQELRTLVSTELPPAERPRKWFAVQELPHTWTGKTARARLSVAIADGSLDLEPLT